MPEKVVAFNRRASYDYEVLERYEAGIVLTGHEVKSIRLGKVSLQDAFARVEKGEVFIWGMHIAPYDKVQQRHYHPTRPRKLLLHRREIDRLSGAVSQKGMTLVPLRLFFNERGIAKLEIALAKGKKLYDKRRAIIEREVRRDIERHLRRRR